MIIGLQIGRKNSKGLVGKNTISIEGLPMAEWSLKAALASKYINKLFISTDDENLKKIALKLGILNIDRPLYLNTDSALGEDVFIYCHDYLQKIFHKKVEILVLLMANAPTISSSMIDQGIEDLKNDEKLDSVVSVSKYNMWSPIRARKISNNGLLEPFVSLDYFRENNIDLNCDRDSQGDVWFADMGVSIIRARNLKNIEYGIPPQRWMGRNISPIKNDGGLDVDYEFQIGQVEYWLRKNKKNII